MSLSPHLKGFSSIPRSLPSAVRQEIACSNCRVTAAESSGLALRTGLPGRPHAAAQMVIDIATPEIRLGSGERLSQERAAITARVGQPSCVNTIAQINESYRAPKEGPPARSGQPPSRPDGVQSFNQLDDRAHRRIVEGDDRVVRGQIGEQREPQPSLSPHTLNQDPMGALPVHESVPGHGPYRGLASPGSAPVAGFSAAGTGLVRSRTIPSQTSQMMRPKP
jgi:hypothetical protein